MMVHSDAEAGTMHTNGTGQNAMDVAPGQVFLGGVVVISKVLHASQCGNGMEIAIGYTAAHGWMHVHVDVHVL